MSNSTRPSSSNSSSSGYDERFVVPLEASRRGAHRARVSPVMAVLPIVAVVGIVVGAIALVYVLLGGGGSTAGADATTAATPSTTASSSGTAAPEATESGSSTTESSSSSLAPGAVDKTITLDVFNATTTSGLAKKAGNKLTAAGWTTGKVETWTGTPVAQTTVYYASDDQKASALAVIKVLGRGTVKLSPVKAGTGMAVVISTDYPGARSPRAKTATSRSAGASATGAATDPAATGDPAATDGAGATRTSQPTDSPTG